MSPLESVSLSGIWNCERNGQRLVRHPLCPCRGSHWWPDAQHIFVGWMCRGKKTWWKKAHPCNTSTEIALGWGDEQVMWSPFLWLLTIQIPILCFLYVFIYLAALDLGCGIQGLRSLIFFAACRIFICAMWTFSWGMWDLVPWPEVKHRPPCIGSIES